jgi:hypothetical protein
MAKGREDLRANDIKFASHDYRKKTGGFAHEPRFAGFYRS